MSLDGGGERVCGWPEFAAIRMKTCFMATELARDVVLRRWRLVAQLCSATALVQPLVGADRCTFARLRARSRSKAKQATGILPGDFRDLGGSEPVQIGNDLNHFADEARLVAFAAVRGAGLVRGVALDQ